MPAKPTRTIRQAFDEAEPVHLEDITNADASNKASASNSSVEDGGIARSSGQHTSFRHENIPVIRKANGQPVWCHATAIALLEHHTDWRGCLHHDVFLQSDMLYKPVPGTDETEEFKVREVRDADIVQAQVWFNRNGFPDATRTTVGDPEIVPLLLFRLRPAGRAGLTVKLV